MISTVTTATVSSITSTVGITASLGFIAVAMLISLLVTKEMARAGNHPRMLTMSRMLNVAIFPLAIVFAAIVVASVVDAL